MTEQHSERFSLTGIPLNLFRFSQSALSTSLRKKMTQMDLNTIRSRGTL